LSRKGFGDCLSSEVAAGFERMKAAEAAHVRAHQTVVLNLGEPELGFSKPDKPRRVPDDELRSSRRDLRDAFYRFLIRGYREGLIGEPLLHKIAESIDLGIDLADFEAVGHHAVIAPSPAVPG
jgi:hypothetical protein